MHEHDEHHVTVPRDVASAVRALGLLDLAEQTTSGLLLRACGLAREVVPAAEAVSVSLLQRDRPSTPVATAPLARLLDEQQYAAGQGPCLAAVREGQAQRVDDARTEPRWPVFVPRAVEAGLRSSLSVPVPVPLDLGAGLNLYSTRAGAFAPQDAEVLAELTSVVGVALANVLTVEGSRQAAEQLRAALDSRAVIEQAKGVLMARLRCSPDEAFARLVDISQRTNRKLRVVAQDLVDAQQDPTG